MLVFETEGDPIQELDVYRIIGTFAGAGSQGPPQDWQIESLSP